jgi:hypothetical protein
LAVAAGIWSAAVAVAGRLPKTTLETSEKDGKTTPTLVRKM